MRHVLIPKMGGERPLNQFIMVKLIKASNYLKQAFLFVYTGYIPLRWDSEGHHWIEKDKGLIAQVRGSPNRGLVGKTGGVIGEEHNITC